jgi:hypothetical protein
MTDLKRTRAEAMLSAGLMGAIALPILFFAGMASGFLGMVIGFGYLLYVMFAPLLAAHEWLIWPLLAGAGFLDGSAPIWGRGAVRIYRLVSSVGGTDNVLLPDSMYDNRCSKHADYGSHSRDN